MSTGSGDMHLADEDADRDEPVLPDEVRRHLGRLLASAYGPEPSDANAPDPFAGLVERLEVALGGIACCAASSFQSELLAGAPVLRRFAVSLTRDPITADDLVQDTMLRAWRGRANFASGTNLEAWTFTIMRNQFYSNRRKAREDEDEDGSRAAKLAVLPEQEGHLDLQDMRTALDRLTPTMREALILITLQNLSYEEAATVMGCRVGTVKSRVWRGRELLARLLGYTGAEVGTSALIA